MRQTRCRCRCRGWEVPALAHGGSVEATLAMARGCLAIMAIRSTFCSAGGSGEERKCCASYHSRANHYFLRTRQEGKVVGFFIGRGTGLCWFLRSTDMHPRHRKHCYDHDDRSAPTFNNEDLNSSHLIKYLDRSNSRNHKFRFLKHINHMKFPGPR